MCEVRKLTKDELRERLRHASTPQERRALLEEYRQYVMANTMPEERKAQMEEFIDQIRAIGREYFPLTSEEEAYGNDCPTGKCDA